MPKLNSLVLNLMQTLEKEYGWKFTEEEYKNTPIRITKMLDEWKAKKDYEKFTVFDNEYNYDELIAVKGIEFMAFCSHHLMPFYGTASIVYLPNTKIIGASKLVRIVEKYAYQAQVQERMTRTIADELDAILQPQGVLVHVEATHMCMTTRGVKQSGNTKMATNALTGIMYTNETLKREALEMIQ